MVWLFHDCVGYFLAPHLVLWWPNMESEGSIIFALVWRLGGAACEHGLSVCYPDEVHLFDDAQTCLLFVFARQ